MVQLDADPDDRELIDIWQQALGSVIGLCASLDDAQWNASTPCPGWTVADVAAHLVDIEQLMAGAPRPDHEPDWAALPHVDRDFSRFAEVGVDVRRGAPRDAVLDELRAVIAMRRIQLDATPEGAEVIGPLGNPTTLNRMLRMRTFDTWVHEQDIRKAIGQDGNWQSAQAIIAFQQMTRSLPVVWSRADPTSAGDTVHVEITGPDLVADLYVEIAQDGRGQACAALASPTVHLTASWPDFMRLECGRVGIDDPALRSRIRLAGDPGLGAALLAGLAITP
jgi:uncharacterized protein (TIGR03083 family)